MPFVPPDEWIRSAFAGVSVTAGGRTHAFRVHPAGELLLPSGRLLATDPHLMRHPEPYDVPLAPGHYPVHLAVSQVSADDQRVAFARLLIADGVVARWTMIAAGGDDPSSLGDSDILGYDVDSGVGCFASAEAAAAMAARTLIDDRASDELSAALERTSRPTWSWADFRPDPANEQNIIAFSSGYGDGVYASYLGSGADGSPLCVVTDFGVLGPEANPPSRPGPLPAEPGEFNPRPWWKLW